MADDTRRNALALDAETMRTLGYQVIDRLVASLADPTSPVPLRDSTDWQSALTGPAPEAGTDLGALLDRFEDTVLRRYGRADHPRYFAFIPGSTTWPSALADLIASVTNIQVDSWYESPGPTALETTVIDWMKGWIGYPSTATGILVSGGSAANMTALACAREIRVCPMSDRLVAYVSDQSHSSLARAARILGFRPTQVRVLPSDHELRMRPRTLEAAIKADKAADRIPFFVAASAGSTNTGQVDPLGDLAAVCHDNDVWFHVDGAYGAFAVLTDEGRAKLVGLSDADSVTVDPHKWLFQPWEIGGLLVRHAGALRRAFEIVPDYLADIEAAQVEINYSDMGMQLTRGARALKMWLSVRYFGLAAFRDAIQRAMDLAKTAQQRIDASDRLELMSPASLGIVCFRRRVDGADEPTIEQVNRTIAHDLETSGDAFVSSTRLHGRYALRLCILNHTSTAADVDGVLDWFESADAGRIEAPFAQYDRQSDVRSAWPGGLSATGDALAAFTLFRSVDRHRLDAAAATATPRSVAAGQAVVQQWESGNDFYLITSGAVKVLVNGEEVRTMGAGEYFGELAALDWGAAFHYPRLATVVATEQTELLALPPTELTQLTHEFEDVAAQIRQSVAERLERS